MSTELREALSSAFDSSGGDDVPAPGPVSDPGPPATEAVAAEVAVPDAAVADGGGDAASAAAARARDDKGRFATKPGEGAPKGRAITKPETPAAKAAVTEPAIDPAAPVVETLKAPQSWKPVAREKWAALPPEAQAEVLRREGEISKSLQEHAGPKRFQEAFAQMLAPYEPLMRSEAAASGRQFNPLATVNGLLQTAVTLRTAPVATKAATVLSIMRTYGVSEQDLVGALQGQGTAQAGAQPQGVDPVALSAQIEQRILSGLQARQQQAMAHKSVGEIEAFAQGKEFFDDVREDMADLLEVSSRRGRTMSLEDAYSRACQMNPELSKVFQQREAAKAATNAQASTQRARAAGSSVKSQPAGAVGAPQRGDGIRDHLEAAVSALSGNR